MIVPPFAKTNIDGVAAKRAISRAIRDGFIELGNTNTASIAALEKKFDLFLVNLALLFRKIGGDSEPISLKNVDERCISDVLTFMHTLSEIEKLVTDSKITEKKRNSDIDKLKDSLSYENCMSILATKHAEKQLTEEEREQFEAGFNALFVIKADPSARRDRWDAIHQFRHRILHFFAEHCYDASPENSGSTVTTSISLVQGGATSEAPGGAATST